MGNLVSPVRSVTVSALVADLRDAHDFLAEAARKLVPELSEPSTARWGTQAKRRKVRLASPRPKLLRDARDAHSFAEVMNQCATIERLLDVLEWIGGEAAFNRWTVEVCHPTTSSSTQRDRGRENDLVLESPDGARARFEVSDVASEKDGNKKLVSELTSLGVMSATSELPPRWPDSRLFVVVSDDFAAHVEKRGTGRYRLARLPSQIEDTVIFEVVPVAASETG
ncbi:MAG: hypothetical protein KJ015_09905 [Myxococcales bacterium]|nr:hypothetical protein [Myxococcales bacterium]